MRILLHGALSSADETQLEGVLELGFTLAGELSDERDLVGDLTTGIELAGALPISFSLSGLLMHMPSGVLGTVARPGEQYATAADDTANRTGLTVSRNSTEPRMVEA